MSFRSQRGGDDGFGEGSGEGSGEGFGDGAVVDGGEGFDRVGGEVLDEADAGADAVGVGTCGSSINSTWAGLTVRTTAGDPTGSIGPVEPRPRAAPTSKPTTTSPSRVPSAGRTHQRRDDSIPRSCGDVFRRDRPQFRGCGRTPLSTTDRFMTSVVAVCLDVGGRLRRLGHEVVPRDQHGEQADQDEEADN